MVWVVMEKSASHKPKPSVTIDYVKGQRYNVPTATAEALASNGAAKIERRKNNRVAELGKEAQIPSDLGESGN